MPPLADQMHDRHKRKSFFRQAIFNLGGNLEILFAYNEIVSFQFFQSVYAYNLGSARKKVAVSLENESYFPYREIGKGSIIARGKAGDGKAPKCISCNQCYKTYGKRCVFNGKKLG